MEWKVKEAEVVLVGLVGAGVDDRVGRGRVDGPGVAGWQAGVAHGVGGDDCEGMAAFDQAAVGSGAAACRVGG